MTTPLSPCPHCGSKTAPPVVAAHNVPRPSNLPGMYYYHVECGGCPHQGPISIVDLDDAAELWNKAAEQSRQRQHEIQSSSVRCGLCHKDIPHAKDLDACDNPTVVWQDPNNHRHRVTTTLALETETEGSDDWDVSVLYARICPACFRDRVFAWLREQGCEIES